MQSKFLKFIIPILAIALIWIGSSFTIKSNQEIPWEATRKLTWADFKGKPDNTLPYYAQTNGSFSYSYSIDGKKIVLSLTVTFDASQSWVKKGAETAYLLNHEQKHFDIWEAHARYFVRSLKTDKELNKENFSKRAEMHFNDVMKKLFKIQENYDSETNHSINEPKQIEWDNKISKVLIDMAKYSNRQIEFTFQ